MTMNMTMTRQMLQSGITETWQDTSFRPLAALLWTSVNVTCGHGSRHQESNREFAGFDQDHVKPCKAYVEPSLGLGRCMLSCYMQCVGHIRAMSSQEGRGLFEPLPGQKETHYFWIMSGPCCWAYGLCWSVSGFRRLCWDCLRAMLSLCEAKRGLFFLRLHLG